MNKKIIFSLFSIVLLVAIITTGILQYRSQKTTITETVPLLPIPKVTQTFKPIAKITGIPGIPQQTNIQATTKQIADAVSLAEKNKFYDALPIRKEDFATSANIKTTINIYSFAYDPSSSIRLEIYGINYNLPEITGPNAVAFKESFLEAKKQLTSRGAIIKNLQIIFGNRQYIQDTASYWVKSFNLLD